MGGGGGGKRNLTALVGKLELLSRDDLKLHVDLDAEQSKNVAAKLDEISKSENMTAEEAQSHLDALEGMLTAEQKTTMAHKSVLILSAYRKQTTTPKSTSGQWIRTRITIGLK